ncbi:membrane protein [Gordonia phage EdmundFerry]|nr:membrane protein [Gordonia phage EdmundFerry]
MGGYQPRRHADAGRPFPYDQVRPPAGGGGVYRSGPGKVRAEFIDRAALAAAAEAARIERRARDQERRRSTARLEQIAYPDGVPKRAPELVDWGSNEWVGGKPPRTGPNVFERAFSSIREHVTAWYCALAFTIIMIAGSAAGWLVLLVCLASVSAGAAGIALVIGRRQYRRQLAAEHAAIAARADEQHHQWMTDPDAWRRQIEGTDER